MADKKISALPAASTPLAGTEVLPVVQGGVTEQVSVANLTAGRAISATQITLTTENVIIGTAGKGIDFSANTHAAGMTSELLDDYEIGTWTPTLTTTGTDFGAVTYDSRVSGRYVKIGRMVHVQGTMRTNSITVGSASGSVAIGNLPYACADNDPGTFNGPSVASLTNAEDFIGDFPLNGLVLNNSTKIVLLYRTAVNTGDLDLQISDLDTGTAKNFVRFSATYVAA